MEWALAYVILGSIVGLFAGLFGIGGGLLLVPALLLLFDMQHFPAQHGMHLALGTSMATILFTALSSMRKHHQHGAVNWPIVRALTPGILLGTLLGAVFAAAISPRALGIFFTLFVYFAALQMLLGSRPKPTRQLPGEMGMGLVGTFTGWISSLVSIGGGTVVVPFLVWCNVPLRHAIGTSAAIGFPVAVGGTVGYIATGINIAELPSPSMGFVYLPALLWVALASMLTAPLGAKATHYLRVGLLRKLFAVLLFALATRLLFKVL